MKKTYVLILYVCMILLLCACGKDNDIPVPTATAAPTPVPVTAPPSTVPPTETPAPTPEPEPIVYDARFVGNWSISRAHNEYAALLEFYGTSLREIGAGLSIRDDGTLTYYIGGSGGEGVWSSEGDLAHAEAVGNNHFTLTVKDIDGETFLEMNFGAAPIIWQRTE